MRDNKQYNLILETAESTVVAEYIPNEERSKKYQTEAALEKAFIEQLESQAYEYLKINNEGNLIQNLRKQLEKLNKYKFTDTEWKNFFNYEIANQTQGIEEKIATIQEDYIKNLTRDDGSVKNIYLINKENIHENSLQVINQYETSDGKRTNRYDVTILVNGLPLVHIELKKRGVAIEEAFNQINRYGRESFWAGSALYEYIQIFVISNGTHTKYYSNTVRSHHTKEERRKKRERKYSFEFTNWWADTSNKPITDLIDFSNTFFTKHTLLNILTRYCVFTTDKELLVMRPYQIVATEQILNRIVVSQNHKRFGTEKSGGYIWHTTGSGKTLTSFKTAQLVSKLPDIEKVLFVVDRKDLDYQTMREYEKFEKGAANSNTSTAVLKKQIENSNAKIIVTTIQKLSHFVKNNKGNAIFNGQIVLIFDECHRSQFGEMHNAIVKSFNKYYLFGFTGTPIFATNTSNFKTTEQMFGEKLHTYTIVNAINDKNVLPFKVDYVSTMREAEDISDTEVKDINRESALSDPKRIKNIVKYICKHFDQKTKRNETYNLDNKSLKGFNSILAVSSISNAKKYYAEFEKQFSDVSEDEKLKIALIYSFGLNDEDCDGMVDENLESTKGLDASSRDFLENAIKDYNNMFGTSFDTSSEKFQGYYKDVSQKVKNREIDLLIVVNMFLTGFDATTLNTLWVDKNLRLHGLLQAYSRTNRILNSIKTFGNIVCFRNLESATNKAIALFGDKDASGIVLLRPYDDYYNGYTTENEERLGYKSLIEELLKRFPIQEQIIERENKKNFIKLYSQILKIHNILESFDEFVGNEILSARDFQDYHSKYIDFYNEFRNIEIGESEDIVDDIIFEMELIKQTEVNIDYILNLIKQYHEDGTKNKDILIDIDKQINSSIKLRNKKDLIKQFIDSIDSGSQIDFEWNKFVEERRIEEIEIIIKEENLNREKTYEFIESAFKDGEISTTGTAVVDISPPMRRFDQEDERSKRLETIQYKLRKFFERFFDISSPPAWT